ncbi:hypothetical protein B0H14DRAFT_114438 [Mycena olivaceomarginata]|nr:hypothetical protein B0H14DRAFT_114438 [Mycena olivaceomarginata]
MASLVMGTPDAAFIQQNRVGFCLREPLQCSPSYMRWAPASYASPAPGDPPYGPLRTVRACKSTSARVHSRDSATRPGHPVTSSPSRAGLSRLSSPTASSTSRAVVETVRPRTPYSFLFPFLSFSQILPALTHPHPRYSPGSTSPSPSTLWPMTGRSSATADPLIERLPGASPTPDPRPTAAPLRIQLTVRVHADLLAYIATPVEWLMLFNEPPGPAACRSST